MQPLQDEFPATELSRRLLESADHNIIQFQRNQQIAYRLVDQTRRAYGKIIPLIRKIDQEPRSAEHWEEFVRYTDAVDVLEKFFLSSLTRYIH